MLHLTHFQLVLWWVSPILQGAIGLVMLRRGLSRELPVFFGYTAYHFVLFWILLLAYRSSYATYFYVYWGSEILDALLVFFVIQEILGNLFRPYRAIRSIGTVLFRRTLLVLVGASTLLAMSDTHHGLDRLMAELFMVHRSSMFIEAGLILFLFLFARLFGLTWRSYAFGISLGFGVMASLSGVGFAMLARLGAKGHEWWGQVVAVAYCLGIMVWLFYVLAPSSSLEINRAEIDSSPLNGWNAALQELLNRRHSTI